MFKIMGRYNGGDVEEIDEFDDRSVAEAMLDEYSMAFGQGWELWVSIPTARR